MSQATLSARYSTTCTDVTSTSISKVQHNQYGCHKHFYQQGTIQIVRMSEAPLSARYTTTCTDVTSTSISNVQYNQCDVTSTFNSKVQYKQCDVTSTSISKVQYIQYGCHKHLYQRGTVQPVRMSQAPLSASYNTTSTDVTSISISKVQHNQYDFQAPLSAR